MKTVSAPGLRGPRGSLVDDTLEAAAHTPAVAGGAAMAVPPQPPSAVTAQPPGLAAPTAMSFYQQPPAGPLQAKAATRALQAGLDLKGAGRGAGRPGWDDAGGDKGHDEDANQQQFVPDWTCDASGQ